MPDITVFKMDIDNPTFNAPFGGRSQSNGSSSNGSSGLNVKLVAGLGGVFLLTGGALAFVLKRRFGSDADDETDDESVGVDFSETDDDNENGHEDENGDDQESGGIRAIIGLSFLIATSAIVKRKIRADDKNPSVAI
jgi:hypothetical protein